MITVLGSINIDLIATSDHLPKPGETVLGNTLDTAAGGKGANQALAARRAGAATAMAGATGDDSFVEPALKNLRSADVDLALVRYTDQPTGTALIVVDARGENIITVIPGANAEITDEDAKKSISKLGSGDTLLMQLEIPERCVATACELAKQKKVRSILNTAPLTAQARQLSKQADIIIANESEFAGLCDDTSSSRDSLKTRMCNFSEDSERTLIVTLGGDGARAVYKKQWYENKALEIEPVDTVGAGDTFCGYLAQALDAETEFAQALARATAAASLACLASGAQSAIPTDQQVLAALG